MPNNKICLITIVLLSLTLLGLIYFWQARRISAPEIQLGNIPIPLQLGEWKGEDITISQRTYEILETKDALMRQYTNSQGESVVLAIVYSAVNRGSFHPPEICYLGGGRELLNKGVERIEMVPPRKNPYTMQVNKLIMQDKAGKEIAWYWFTAGSRVTSNYYLQQCYFIWDEIRHKRTGGALIRVSIRVADNSQIADVQGKDFIKQIAPILLDYLS
jgi:EpsI family protein